MSDTPEGYIYKSELDVCDSCKWSDEDEPGYIYCVHSTNKRKARFADNLVSVPVDSLGWCPLFEREEDV
jgi:hypothetical protein